RDIELHHCLDAKSAVETAARLDPAVILQDLVMPDIDGLTLVAQYRNNPKTGTTPVVVLSANDDADARARARAAGATDHLVQVPAKDDLVACIRAHASRETATEVTFDAAAIAALRKSAPDLKPEFLDQLMDQFVGEAQMRVGDLRAPADRADNETIRSTA